MYSKELGINFFGNESNKKTKLKKIDILKIFIEIKDNNEKFLDYFENYSNYLSKITLNSFTKSVIDHKF